jgi:hypothetical protein
VGTELCQDDLPNLLRSAYTKNDDGEYINYGEEILALVSMLRVLLLHDGPPAQRRALLDARFPLLPPLQDLVHDYEEPTTTDELWATGLGATL